VNERGEGEEEGGEEKVTSSGERRKERRRTGEMEGVGLQHREE
jgi:hypothetical protein